jgi:hypothetical protein
MNLNAPLMDVIPPAEEVRHRLGDALREVELLRRLLNMAERAEAYRDCDRRLPEKGVRQW